ncbi:MAG: hypothetical protein E3K37_16650 [Candidatus Kuenenia sp.]|nr:hypothetical protein [Candidatus Kuenenia hertensis]
MGKGRKIVINWLANILVVKFWRKLRICGALRFRILNFSHNFIPASGLHKQYDFVLKYLPKSYDKKVYKINVLDIGSTPSLFIYELDRRGYITSGIDLRPYPPPPSA